MPAIVARDLSKTFTTKVRPSGRLGALRSLVKPEYRDVRAVKGVSFEIDDGELVAFLGPNGAGKSTTIKMLMGILRPTGGSATVLGLDPVKDRVELSRYIGAVFGQKSQLWFHLPPSDSFRLLGSIYEIDDDDRKWREGELIERFGLAPYWDVPVRKLSLGERIRCEIAASLLPSPVALFLTSPTKGLDVVAKREIRQLLAEAARVDDTTIFMTSHDMGDIEKVCKRAIIIHHGEVVVDESMKALKHRSLSRKYVGVRYASPVDLELPGLSPVKRTPRAASFEVDTSRHSLAEVVRALAARGDLEDITVEDEPLESVIAAIYETRSGAEAQALGLGAPRGGAGAAQAGEAAYA